MGVRAQLAPRRMALAYAVSDLSLKDVAAWASAMELAEISGPGATVINGPGKKAVQCLSGVRRRTATRAALMLNLSPVRLRWRESVSLGRFQNCNLLEMGNFRRHGVEDESQVLAVETGAISRFNAQWAERHIMSENCRLPYGPVVCPGSRATTRPEPSSRHQPPMALRFGCS